MLGRGREPEPAVEESPPDFHGLRPPEKPRKVVAFDMQLDPLQNPRRREDEEVAPDLTAPLSDEILLRIFSHLPSPLQVSAGLVCKKWLRLLGRLRRSLTLLDWSFLDSPSRRLVARFPDLTDVDLVPASISPPVVTSGILLSRGHISVQLDSDFESSEDSSPDLVSDGRFLPPETMDRGLGILSGGCPSLRKLSMVAVASDRGLMNVADNCPTLLELDLHWCTDSSLSPISAFSNLQILKVIGCVEGLFRGSGITDIGLTILAHSCKRLVKLDLIGCEGSYDGISAIGRCCLMLEELTLCDHRMDAGWIAGLSFCGNLKTLRLIHCRIIDKDPGPVEHLGSCAAIEHLHLQRCQLRDKRSLNALFFVCEAVKDIVFHDCWGLDDDIFGTASLCRMVRFLSLEGCSLLTTEGLEAVILSWMDLQSLRVVSCNRVRDSEITPALANLFSWLKVLKWRPDSRSVLMESLAGTGMGKKGGRLFNWV